MEPAEVNLEFVQGDRYELIVNIGGVADVVDGDTFRAHVRPYARSSTVTEFAIEVDDVLDRLTLLLTPEQTATMREDNVWDLEWVNYGGEVGPLTFIAGTVHVTREVTRDE
jgi:hypothetical protein